MTTLLLILMVVLLIAALERAHRRQPPHPPSPNGTNDPDDRDWARTKLDLLALGGDQPPNRQGSGNRGDKEHLSCLHLGGAQGVDELNPSHRVSNRQSRELGGSHL